MKPKSLLVAQKRYANGNLARGKSLEVMSRGILTDHVGINRSLKFIRENYCMPIQQKDVLKVSGLSRRGFCKAFLKNVGVSPGKLLGSMRIEYAKHLLVEQELTLSQFAKKCGYRQACTFSVAFQRATGTSPMKFQKRHWRAAYRDYTESKIQVVTSDQMAPASLNVNALIET